PMPACKVTGRATVSCRRCNLRCRPCERRDPSPPGMVWRRQGVTISPRIFGDPRGMGPRVRRDDSRGYPRRHLRHALRICSSARRFGPCRAACQSAASALALRAKRMRKHPKETDMATHKLLLLPGDGIGPEVMAEVKRLIDWLNAKGIASFETD